MEDVVPTWTVVQFVEDGTVEAIPSNWIQGDMSLATLFSSKTGNGH